MAARIPYTKLPGFLKPTVTGHKGELVLGRLSDTPILVLNGRLHYYEGHTMGTVTFGIRLLARLGVTALVVTHAAGGIHPRFRVGDLMLLKDHINLMGANPLVGLPTEGGPCFVDMSRAYDPQLRAFFRRAAHQAKITLREGVYLAVSGPSYETPAEIRAFRRLGADAVGMSTVPEIIVARQLGLRVAGLSCISNLAAGIGTRSIDHKDVLQTGARAARQTARLLKHFARLYGQDR